jgi:hypothetical protein
MIVGLNDVSRSYDGLLVPIAKYTLTNLVREQEPRIATSVGFNKSPNVDDLQVDVYKTMPAIEGITAVYEDKIITAFMQYGSFIVNCFAKTREDAKDWIDNFESAMINKNQYRGKCLYAEKESMFFKDVPKVTWDDVILDEKAKKDIRLNTSEFLGNSKFAASGVNKRGIVMYGPPGTGKTSLLRHYLNKYCLDCIVTYDEQIMCSDSFYVDYMTDTDSGVLIVEDADILLNSRTTEGRGVTGLAPEPSYYGLTIIQMWLLLYVVNKKRALRLDVLTICALQIFVLSKSPLAIIIAISLLFLYFLFNPNKILLIVLIVLMGVFIFSDIFIISGRFARFIEVVKENPGGLLYVDGSVSERFFHIYLSIKHSFANYLVPHGFNSFEYVVDLGQSQYDAYWWAMAKTKILSGIGASLFELGWFGLVYIFSFIYFVIYYQKNLIKDRYLILVGFFLIMINAVNYSAPCFWLMMGYVAAANRPSIKTKSSSINNSHDELIS